MSEWKHYRKCGTTEMRPYVPGEDLSNAPVSAGLDGRRTCVSVNKEDKKEVSLAIAGGMVARNSDNHADQWYVAKAYFEKMYEPVSGETSSVSANTSGVQGKKTKEPE